MTYPKSPSLTAGHRHRLREKFRLAGADRLPGYEALELLLTFAIARKDVKPIAKDLLACFGGFRAVVDAPLSMLQNHPGLGVRSATLIKLVRELCELYLLETAQLKTALGTPEQVVEFARLRLAGRPHEAFMIIFLNVQNEILCHEILNEGTIDQVAVYPRRIIEKALARHAAGLILAHNHPSGHTAPSEEDKRLTRAVREAARLLDIRVLDHIVVGSGGYYSFLQHGLC